MENELNIYESYLTDHLNGTINTRSRFNKKKWIEANYSKIFPKDIKANILEIVPGHGELLELLIKDKHYENVMGVDLSDEVANLCNEIMPNSTKKIEDTVAYLNNNADKYDVIFMLQVLEHIPKDVVKEFLISLRNALRSGGVAVIEVPNIENNIVGVGSYFSDFTHEVPYTSESLCYVLRSAKFTEISIHELKVPIYSIARAIQSVAQNIVNNIMLVAKKIYRPSHRYFLSPSIYALAYK